MKIAEIRLIAIRRFAMFSGFVLDGYEFGTGDAKDRCDSLHRATESLANFKARRPQIVKSFADLGIDKREEFATLIVDMSDLLKQIKNFCDPANDRNVTDIPDYFDPIHRKAEELRDSILRRYQILLDLVGQPAPPTPGDESAYVFASKLPEWGARFNTMPLLMKFLDKTDAIRKKPHGKNRRKVHVGDWVHYWDQQDDLTFSAMDAETMDEMKANIAARAATERNRRQRK